MTFNGEMFRLARQFRGFSQRELADAVEADASHLSRVENGLVQPSDDFAMRVAKKLSFPLDFFQQPEKIFGLPLSVHPMWRKKAAVTQHDTDRALAEVNIRLVHIRRLLRSVEFDPVLRLPEFDIESNEGDTEKIALQLRRSWMMPAGPIDNLTAWVERAGCFVVHVDLPDVAMDGLTLRTPDLPPCIFLNRAMSADRMRFTLAHELGHLVMHRYPTPAMEKEANSFAGALLMPAADIGNHFRNRRIDLKLLASLKPEWRVAMQSILFRAKELGYTDPNQERYLWAQFNAKKIRMREPPELDFAKELPVLAPRMLTLHVEQLGYSVADLEKVVHMYSDELTTFHNLGSATGKAPLRLVL
jgi:Zn-dependent peptidase ImmA (M78 family)/transcriptional regulator with XRE-family HTH domain